MRGQHVTLEDHDVTPSLDILQLRVVDLTDTESSPARVESVVVTQLDVAALG